MIRCNLKSFCFFIFKGVLNLSEGKFQLTAKFSSNNQHAFEGRSTEVMLTVDRPSLGSPVAFNLMFGYQPTVLVR